ncbi:hypothetical protein VTO73DRAFT_11010 [Trametes versicolor]
MSSSLPSCSPSAPRFVEETRQRLSTFITRKKLATTALTGLGF